MDSSIKNKGEAQHYVALDHRFNNGMYIYELPQDIVAQMNTVVAHNQLVDNKLKFSAV